MSLFRYFSKKDSVVEAQNTHNPKNPTDGKRRTETKADDAPNKKVATKVKPTTEALKRSGKTLFPSFESSAGPSSDKAVHQTVIYRTETNADDAPNKKVATNVKPTTEAANRSGKTLFPSYESSSPVKPITDEATKTSEKNLFPSFASSAGPSTTAIYRAPSQTSDHEDESMTSTVQSVNQLSQSDSSDYDSDCQNKQASTDLVISDSEDIPATTNKPKLNKFKQKYRLEYTTLYPWIQKKYKETWCSVCDHVIEGSLAHIKRHAITKKHISRARVVVGVEPIENVLCQNAKTAKKMEEKIVMFAVEHNVSFNSITHLTKLIKEVSLHPKAVAAIKCGRTKARQIVVNRFGPQQQLALSVKLRTVLFSIIIDETTDVSSSKSVAMTARFRDGNKIVSTFFGLVECPQATADVLFGVVINKLKENNIPLTQIIGYGADNANVMMGSKSGLKAKFESVIPDIFTMGCICHSLDLCSSAASSKIPKTVEQFVHDVYNHFAHSAKRKHEFKKSQEFFEIHLHAMLRPCDTRWLSLKNAIDRLLEQWDPLKHYFKKIFEEDAAFKGMSEAFHLDLLRLYLYFLSYTLNIVCKMNVEFQSENAKIHLLHSRMETLYKTLLANYLKKDYIEKYAVHLINPRHLDHYLPLEDIYCGNAAESFMTTSKYIPTAKLNEFKVNVLNYYVELCSAIRKRFDFSSTVLIDIKKIDPNFFLTQQKMHSISSLISRFPNMCCNNQNAIEEEYREMQTMPEIKELPRDDIEIFWAKAENLKNGMGEPLFGHISGFAFSLLSLPHSSAEVERIFSVLNIIKTKLRNRLHVKTCESLILSKDYLKTHGTHCYMFNDAIKNTHSQVIDITEEDCKIIDDVLSCLHFTN